MPTPYLIKKLVINRMPGFEKGFKDYNEFDSGINIIAGPNASGKSSTARIIQRLLWGNHSDEIQAEASAIFGEEKWDLKLNPYSRIVQKEGVDAEIPDLPPFENRDRYRLALHDMVREKDVKIAEEILKIASGGYDLKVAHDELGYSGSIKSKSLSEFRDYETKNKGYLKEKNAQEALTLEEEKLELLRKKRKEAKEAGKVSVFLEKVKECRTARRYLDSTNEGLISYPEFFENIKGDESEKLESLKIKTQEKETEIRSIKNQLDSCNNILNSLKLPSEGLREGLIREMEERLEILKSTDEKISELKISIEKARKLEIESLHAMGDIENPEKWKGINLKGIDKLDEFLQSAHLAASKSRYLKVQLEEMDKLIKESSFSQETIMKGIETLRAWLNEKEEKKGINRYKIILLALFSILTPMAVLLFGWPGILGLIPFFIVLITMLTEKSSSDGGKAREIRKRDYNLTGLPEPESWTDLSVSSTLSDLEKRLAEGKIQEMYKSRTQQLKEDESRQAEKENEIRTQGAEYLSALGAMPELPWDDPEAYDKLYWFLKRLNNWQENYIQRIGDKVELEEKQAAFIKTLEEINVLLREAGYDSATDPVEAKSSFEQLKDDDAKWRVSIQNQNGFNTRKDDLLSDLKILTDEEAEIYVSLQVTRGDSTGIRDCMEEHKKYNELKEKKRSEEQTWEDRSRTVEADPLYEKWTSKLEEITDEGIETGIEDFQEKSETLENLIEQINKIMLQTDQAREGAELEVAMEERSAALDNLAREYKQNLESMTGDLLVGALREDSFGHNRSEVFGRADKILNKITSGRYSLKINEGDETGFRAYDANLDIGQDLEQLSTGTRIQLLFAVRLAYIEQMEKGTALPIMADELLANCDDIRAGAIIETLEEISKSRQVFYFTAQGDEVSKWKEYLEKNKKASYKIFILPNISGDREGYPEEGTRTKISLVKDIPEPGKMNHFDYGALLDVEPFNPAATESRNIHLWFLIEDNDILYNCLSKSVTQWIHLKSLADRGQRIQGLDPVYMNKLEKIVGALDTYITAFRKGRSKPIHPSDLIKSEAVTDVFIKPVSDKLEELKYNPASLISALKEREIRGFREASINELEEYLIGKGFLSNEEIMTEEEIERELIDFSHTNDIDLHEIQKVIDRIQDAGLI